VFYKRWISRIVACMFIFNYIGYVAGVIFVQQQLKNDAVQRLTSQLCNGHYTKFFINPADINLLGQADEGELNISGKIYDIIKREQTGSGIVCYCLNDKEEESILQCIDDHIDTQNGLPVKSHHPGFEKQFLKDFFYCDKGRFTQNQIFEAKPKAHFLERLTSAHLQKYGPPPKFS